MLKKSEKNTLILITMMKYKTHEEMLSKYIGAKGTSNRVDFDENVRAGVEAYSIGEAIKETRKKQNLTQEQLGARMGVKKAQVSKIESGRGVTFATIVKAFKALGASTAQLDLGSLGKVALW
ncbi:MAG: helix-turn-helix domain-containing protein [Paludibacteraceae bacterium]|nr:helix-turn-helix domain-containing protein [Paludibacteraceae bacterium]